MTTFPSRQDHERAPSFWNNDERDVTYYVPSFRNDNDRDVTVSFWNDDGEDTKDSKWTPVRVGTYLVSKKLGGGSFGSVYICKHTENGRQYAGKLFDKYFVRGESNMKMIISEVAILKEVSHENTISFVDLVFSQHGVLLVMELVNGSNLLRFSPSGKGMIESFARVVFEQLLKAIQHIHSQRIIHRDIKMENVMLDKRGTVKLVDYGLAEKSLEGSDGLKVTGYCGTAAYYSPELAQGELDGSEKDNEFAGDKIDIWAAGVLLYRIVSGKDPFVYKSKQELLHEISQNNTLWDVDFSCELRDLLKKILRIDPEERMSIDEILRHAWMKCEKFPSLQKETFTSKSQRVQVEIDVVTPAIVQTWPKTPSESRSGAHFSKRGASMAEFVDWRKNAARNEVGTSHVSERNRKADKKATIDFNDAETSGFCLQTSQNSHSEPSARNRISFLLRLMCCVPRLLRRRPRPLSEADIAQVW